MSVFAFSDIHAQYKLWEQIKNFIKPEDKVFFLGDAIDRGSCGLEILNEIMEMPNITYLRGNHEDFIISIGSMLNEFSMEDWDFIEPYFNLWKSNGASKTIDAFLQLTPLKRKDLIEKIKKLPTAATYVNKNGNIIHLCHAGKDTTTKEEIFVNNSGLAINNYIWDRSHLSRPWHGKNNEFCVHGHTPVGALKQFIRPAPESKTKIFRYCDGHKIDIDLGSFATHTTCLLNLDTFEPIYFSE